MTTNKSVQWSPRKWIPWLLRLAWRFFQSFLGEVAASPTFIPLGRGLSGPCGPFYLSRPQEWEAGVEQGWSWNFMTSVLGGGQTSDASCWPWLGVLQGRRLEAAQLQSEEPKLLKAMCFQIALKPRRICFRSPDLPKSLRG